MSGKLFLITGGGSGIGRAVCQLVAKAGGTAIVTDFNMATAEKTASLLPGKDHTALELDVSDASQVEKSMEKILGAYSAPPTVLVNSAGITRDSFLLKMTAEQFTSVLDVNLKGTFAVTQAVCGALVAAKLGGSIVNVASIVGQTGNMGQANYAASKAGVEAFTKSVAKEMGPYGIRCNAVVPGFIRTQMTENIPEKVKNLLLSHIPTGRMGTPEEVAEVIMFLASDQASYVNGAAFKGLVEKGYHLVPSNTLSPKHGRRLIEEIFRLLRRYSGSHVTKRLNVEMLAVYKKTESSNKI